MDATESLANLLEEYPLPEGWPEPELFQDEVVINDLRLKAIGLAVAAPTGEMLTGSAAEAGQAPLARAFFELTERIAVIEALAAGASRPAWGGGEPLPLELVFPRSSAPAVWSYARSNGVAVHARPELAAAAARRELLERDAVLRSWRGETTPIAAAIEVGGLADLYAFQGALFPQPGADDCFVAGVLGVPKSAAHPVVLGFGAAGSGDLALLAARRETLQRLAFLWGEVIEEAPAPAPTPSFHQEYYLSLARAPRLEAWFAGHRGRGATARDCPARPYAVRYADLTPARLAGRLTVLRALASEALPLTFGAAPIAGLAEDQWIHPIA